MGVDTFEVLVLLITKNVQRSRCYFQNSVVAFQTAYSICEICLIYIPPQQIFRLELDIEFPSRISVVDLNNHPVQVMKLVMR
jgi:hypothetical protein